MGGTLNATWYSPIPSRTARTANGTTMGAYTAAYLPITIESGLVYQLTATIHKTAGNQAWAALGFISAGPPAETIGRVYISNWSDHRSTAAVRVYSTVNAILGPPEFFAGPGESNKVPTDAWTNDMRGEQTVSIILDTTEEQWKIQAFVGDVPSSVYTYSVADSKPENFRYVGFGGDASANNIFKDFSLVVIPEPASAALTLLGGAVVLVRRRVR